MKERFWRRASLFKVDQLGNLEWGSSNGDFDSWLKGALEGQRLSLSTGAL